MGGAAHSKVSRPAGIDFLTSRALKLAPDNDKVKELLRRNSQIAAVKDEPVSNRSSLFAEWVRRAPLHLLLARKVCIRMHRAAFCLLLIVGISAGVRADGPFVVLENTSSPDGRYAFAWAAPEKYKIDWVAMN